MSFADDANTIRGRFATEWTTLRPGTPVAYDNTIIGNCSTQYYGKANAPAAIETIRQQIASAIQVVVQTSRLVGGPRKVVKISEVTGMEGEVISMHDIFEFKKTGVDENRIATGFYQATGIRPHCLQRLADAGIGLPLELFERRELYSSRNS